MTEPAPGAKERTKDSMLFWMLLKTWNIYDIETGSEVYKKGIHIPDDWSDFESPEKMFQRCYEGTKNWLDFGKFLSFFGGEHSISIGIIKAFYERFPKLNVLQIDAHCRPQARVWRHPLQSRLRHV